MFEPAKNTEGKLAEICGDDIHFDISGFHLRKNEEILHQHVEAIEVIGGFA
ncbi:hypothetical protein D3C87_1832450 [compost metagenome]